MSLLTAKEIIPRETPISVEKRDTGVYTVAGVFLALAAVALGLRFASKRILRKPLRVDDYLVVWAFVSHSLPPDQVASHRTLGDIRCRSSYLYLEYKSPDIYPCRTTDSH